MSLHNMPMARMLLIIITMVESFLILQDVIRWATGFLSLFFKNHLHLKQILVAHPPVIYDQSLKGWDQLQRSSLFLDHELEGFLSFRYHFNHSCTKVFGMKGDGGGWADPPLWSRKRYSTNFNFGRPLGLSMRGKKTVELMI